ncbi:hypothetical protein AB0J66_22380 [Actinoplanes sp. NPDC049598]|uniref:hypothetical protein n=1 Tax=Actinoplanes sp. NPDC049598 TaxID=3154626 RepID=UPI003439FDA9
MRRLLPALADDGRSFISLSHDGGFVAGGLTGCIGPLGLVDPATNDVRQVTDIPDGEGTWHYGPNPAGGDSTLTMQFQGQDGLRLPWYVRGPVEWRFHPVALTLDIINQSGDAEIRHCSFHA